MPIVPTVRGRSRIEFVQILTDDINRQYDRELDIHHSQNEVSLLGCLKKFVLMGVISVPVVLILRVPF